MPPGGYFGSALLVDLSAGSGEAAPIEASVLRAYIGGAGLGTGYAEYCRRGSSQLDPRRR
jgi:aldehyde:ferredoxin oxidoreductase